MNSEKVTKKLAIFYHPLFQHIFRGWVQAVLLNSETMNMMIFIEINLRIQKAMIEQFDFNNSLSSAMTDWLREVKNLMNISDDSKQIKKHTTNKDKDPITILLEQLNGINFDTTMTNEKYKNYFKIFKSHKALKFANQFLSIEGFGKFLFDLCTSWCEDLDIELYAFFLLGLFSCIFSSDDFGIYLRRTQYVYCLPSNFHTQMRLMKSHYSRYKKIDLYNYQSWYEWNYMPFRLREILGKIVENFSAIFPSETLPVSTFEKIFKSAIGEIEINQLYEPTTLHFGTISDMIEEGDIHQKNDGNHVSTEESTSFQLKFDPNQNTQKHAKAVKKVSIPIFGKQITKESEQKNRVLTINSVNMFIDHEDELSPNENLNTVNGLYPIWEKEISEIPSEMCSRTNSQKKSRFLVSINPDTASPKSSIDPGYFSSTEAMKTKTASPSTKSFVGKIKAIESNQLQSTKLYNISQFDPLIESDIDDKQYKIFDFAPKSLMLPKSKTYLNHANKKADNFRLILGNPNLFKENLNDNQEEKIEPKIDLRYENRLENRIEQKFELLLNNNSVPQPPKYDNSFVNRSATTPDQPRPSTGFGFRKNATQQTPKLDPKAKQVSTSHSNVRKLGRLITPKVKNLDANEMNITPINVNRLPMIQNVIKKRSNSVKKKIEKGISFLPKEEDPVPTSNFNGLVGLGLSSPRSTKYKFDDFKENSHPAFFAEASKQSQEDFKISSPLSTKRSPDERSKTNQSVLKTENDSFQFEKSMQTYFDFNVKRNRMRSYDNARRTNRVNSSKKNFKPQP